MKRLLIVILTPLVGLFLCGIGAHLYRAAGLSGVTSRISVATDGTEGNGQSYYAAIAANGQSVAFDSDATTLVPNDSNGQRDIFIYDRLTRHTDLISLATDGNLSNGFSEFPTLSADGRVVVYHSDATNLVADDTNGMRDVFSYDRSTGTTTRLSLATDGLQGNAPSSRPVVSMDGQLVVFYSDASNLVSDDTNNATDVFIHDRLTGRTARLSVASDGTPGNGPSFHPSISDDGTLIVFGSAATNLVKEDRNNAADVFLHNRTTGQTMRLSTAGNGASNGESRMPVISGDGTTVAFVSEATNLVPGDTNQAADIFVMTRDSGITIRVSAATDGTEANDRSLKPAISRDGHDISFYSFASNLVDHDTNNATDIFVHSTTSGITQRISLASSGAQADRYSFDPAISADGHTVAFSSDATTLVPGDTNDMYDIFVHERLHRFFLPVVRALQVDAERDR